MTYFELNSVIISILVAFALSEILCSWGLLVEERARVENPWLYLAGTSWLFGFLVTH